MKHLHRALRAAALLFVAALGNRADADVRVVTGPGGSSPYHTIQAAVDASVDGDVVLVKASSTFAGFTITNKSLTVVGDTTIGYANVNSRVIVQNLAATRTVVLSRLNIAVPSPAVINASIIGSSLYANGISGQLRLEQCRVIGQDGVFDWLDWNEGTPGFHAAWFENSSGGIALSECYLRGGGGAWQTFTNLYCYVGGRGGDALILHGARASIDDCEIVGGLGGDTHDQFGADAGAGMHLNSGSNPTVAIASHTTFTGTDGGSCGDPQCAPIQSGDGGDGVVIEPSTSVYFLDPTATGGPPGGWCCAGGSHAGATGVGVRNNGGIATTFAVSHVSMTLPAIVRAGANMPIQITADPGDAIYLFESPRTSFIGQVSWRGYWLTKPVGPQLYTKPPTPLVVLPGTGSASFTIPAPAIPTQQGRTHYYQAYRVTPSGSLTLGGFAAVTVVQPGF